MQPPRRVIFAAHGGAVGAHRPNARRLVGELSESQQIGAAPARGLELADVATADAYFEWVSEAFIPGFYGAKAFGANRLVGAPRIAQRLRPLLAKRIMSRSSAPPRYPARWRNRSAAVRNG